MTKKSICLNCHSEIEYNPHHSKGKYCNNKCQKEYEKRKFINDWKVGLISGGKSYNLSNYVRNFLLENSNYRCSKCNWSEINPYTGKVPLEIDHIDDNPFNHSFENLQVLCPNCHSLKTKAPNKSAGGRYKNKKHPRYLAQ